jgi:hypothetical protein
MNELVQHNILHSTLEVAPNIQATQLQIKKQVRAASLDHKLEHRPLPSTLVENRILHDAADVMSPTDRRESGGARSIAKKLEERSPVDLPIDLTSTRFVYTSLISLVQ